MRDYDDITSFLGECGPFQWTIFILLSLSTIPNGYSGIAMVFLSDTPHHHCSLPYLNSTGSNLSQALPLEEVNGQLDYSRCTRYTRLNSTEAQFSNETERCLDGWDFSKEQYISTITTEWNLVCGDAWKVPFSLSVFFMGVLTGSFVAGHLSDRFGRKSVLFLTMAVQTIFTLIQAFSVSWEMFAILYFLIGMGQISNYITAFILGNELLPESSRLSFSTVGVGVFYSLGYAVLPLCAYFIRSWKILLLVLALPGFLYIPLWWFSVTISYYGLSLSTPNMSGDAYVNCVLSAVMELVANIGVWLLLKVASRRAIISSTLLIGGTVLLVIQMVPEKFSSFSIGLAMVGKLGVTAAFSVLYISAMELYPTVVRGMGVGVCSMSSRIGGISSPFLVFMSGPHGLGHVWFLFPPPRLECHRGPPALSAGPPHLFLTPQLVCRPQLDSPSRGTHNKALPYIVMGLLMLAVGLLSLLLPETRGIALPEDLSQVQPLNCCCYRGEPAAEPEAFNDDQLSAEDRNVQMKE
ncbi:hypothetical protein SKAU_G00038570 [Synaphobranchus kaupii]|uniref:Major facilitator superfamily (MFS) profile domain-containing protein n=1 Tax=Synaphobranchus kaupii TaxID=118154 RepID=A0A9Q1GH06_SYNKA|nr:hypothetical protein SKAU_G00038570 [Synaphobranchus kaupii]